MLQSLGAVIQYQAGGFLGGFVPFAMTLAFFLGVGSVLLWIGIMRRKRRLLQAKP
jgi:hypothetical protein